MKKIVKDALVLFAITLVAGILLGVVYQITLDPIAKANENAKEKAYKAVLAEADSFETIDALPSDDDINASSDIDFSKDKVNEVAIGKKGSETAGYVVTVTDSDGYGGDIKFTVGISTDGKVLGVSFLSISETAGLGMRAKQDPSFTSQFTAKSDAVASFSVVTDGSASESNANVDAIGGSTMRLQFTSLWQETREVRTLNKCIERLYNGIIKENPTLVLTLGMCPTLAVTTSAINGIGMGLSSTVVLALSNLMISLLRKAIPDGVRMPAFIVVVASFVTMVQFLMQGFLPSLYDSLGIYIPLIVVNCIILGRAEAYASKNPPIPSFFDGIGMGLGFTIAITILGAIRELIGGGTIFSDGTNALFDLSTIGYTPASIFILAPGAFFVLAFMIAIMNRIKRKKGMKPAEVPDYTEEIEEAKAEAKNN